ncbi:hypothetical protein BDF20DRAFT_163929 [Mycotypha africana]|uniref:uncharacterized protein n=1 Tax=Mycotypha africana TaxID=64632 RepID=UPI002301463A|nr:uncharacterized protein BDF20DRAFT_163929 [Mycotypha africana]KAI8968157.1 hypothetical protein BDF20DRAFT_163929 [Mycotypha africana]
MDFWFLHSKAELFKIEQVFKKCCYRMAKEDEIIIIGVSKLKVAVSSGLNSNAFILIIAHGHILNYFVKANNAKRKRGNAIDQIHIAGKSIDVEPHSGFRIKSRTVSATAITKFLENVEFYALQDVQSHTKEFSTIHVGAKPSSAWSTIGIVDKCYEHKDLLLSVRLTDMRNSYTQLYITGKAYTMFREDIKHGTIIAVKRISLLKPNNIKQSIALHVDLIQQICIIGISLDLTRCIAYKSPRIQCDEYIDGRTLEYCDKHLKQALDFSKRRRAEMMTG